MFLDEDACNSQQPPPVVGQSKIDCAAEVDVAHPAPFLRQPDPAPAENFAHHIGVLFPDLVLLVLEFERGSRLPAYVVRSLDVGGERSWSMRSGVGASGSSGYEDLSRARRSRWATRSKGVVMRAPFVVRIWPVAHPALTTAHSNRRRRATAKWGCSARDRRRR